MRRHSSRMGIRLEVPRTRRAPDRRRRASLESLELRCVLSSALQWTTIGEGAVADNVVSMGVAGRAEGASQPLAFHGAYAKLPFGRKFEIAFEFDLTTWDSYNNNEGYWDSFSVSISSVPYPQLNVLQDPLQLQFVWGGARWTDGVIENNSGQKVITAQFNVASTYYVNVMLDTITQPTADNAYPSWGTVKVFTGNMDAIKDDGTPLEDNKEETAGAYVALNNDNDNYNFSAGTTAIVDKDENTKVVGETDLVPLKIEKIAPLAAGGSYSIVNNSAKIKLWKTADKDGAVDGTTLFDAKQDTTIYVEGITKSAGKAQEELILQWTNGTVTAKMDTVKYTVYEVTGATNVPDFAIYTYKADVPGGGTPKWTATNGTVKTGATAATSTILWGAGPVVGKAKFSPVAGFSVEREVNVVQVQLDISGATNKFTFKNPPSQDATTQKLISSNATGPTMDAKLRVLTLKGPTVGGTDRGVKFIELGMIQNGQFTAKHGDYDGFTPKKRRKSSLEDGTMHLDHITGASASTAPWYDTNAVTGTRGFLGPSTDASQTNVDFNVGDTPAVFGTDNMDLTIGAVTDKVDRLVIVFDFNLYFAVRTKESVNGSESVYTQRAKGSWQFDGTGSVDAAGTWTQTGMGNTGSAKFTEVKTGDVVPITTGVPINTLFGSETWTTVNQ